MINENLLHGEVVYGCPHCQSPSFCKNGKENSVQRYKCKKCNKTFRATTGTALHYMHKKKLANKYIKTMYDGLSIRKAAIAVGISFKTSFAWRHRFLSSLAKASKISQQSENKGRGVKIFYLPYSDKGRIKEPEKYTGKTTNILLLGRDQVIIKKLKPEKTIKNATELLRTIDDKSYLANQSDRILNKAIKKTENNCLSKNTEAFKKLNKEIDETVNQLMNWMERFQGVATKYLDHYWSWFSGINKTIELIKGEAMFKELCKASQSINDYRKITAL